MVPWWMWLTGVLMLAAFAWLVVGVARGPGRPEDTPRRILDERFARGEVDRDEYGGAVGRSSKEMMTMRRMTLAGIGLAAVPRRGPRDCPGPSSDPATTPVECPSSPLTPVCISRCSEAPGDDAGSRHAGHVGHAPADGLDDGPDELDDEPTGVTSACEAKSDRCGVPMGPVASRSIHE